MFVALFNGEYGKDYADFDNFLDMKEFDFLPNINSLIDYEGEYYRIEHYRPITFTQYENREIMCVFVSLMVFDKDDCYNDLRDFFTTHKTKERKYKIKRVLED